MWQIPKAFADSESGTPQCKAFMNLSGAVLANLLGFFLFNPMLFLMKAVDCESITPNRIALWQISDQGFGSKCSSVFKFSKARKRQQGLLFPAATTLLIQRLPRFAYPKWSSTRFGRFHCLSDLHSEELTITHSGSLL